MGANVRRNVTRVTRLFQKAAAIAIQQHGRSPLSVTGVNVRGPGITTFVSVMAKGRISSLENPVTTAHISLREKLR
jgi:hypothetical protein